MAAACLGFALGQLRLHAGAAPILPREGVYAVEGRVVDLAPLPSGDRLLLGSANPLGPVLRRDARHHPGQSAPGASGPRPRRPRPAARAAAATPAAAPARRVRLRPAGLVRRVGCHRASHLGRPSASPDEQSGLGAGDRRAAVGHRPAHRRRKSRACGRHGGGPGRRGPGRDRSGDLASHADLRIGPHPLCLRAAHGPGSRRCLRHLPLAVGSVSAARIAGRL